METLKKILKRQEFWAIMLIMVAVLFYLKATLETKSVQEEDSLDNFVIESLDACEKGEWIEINPQFQAEAANEESAAVNEKMKTFSGRLVPKDALLENYTGNVLYYEPGAGKLKGLETREMNLKTFAPDQDSLNEANIVAVQCRGAVSDPKQVADRRTLMKYVSNNLDEIIPLALKDDNWEAVAFHFVDDSNFYLEITTQIPAGTDLETIETKDAALLLNAVPENNLNKAGEEEGVKYKVKVLAFLTVNPDEDAEDYYILKAGDDLYKENEIIGSYVYDYEKEEWSLGE